MIRSFFAIDLPAEFSREIRRIQDRLRRSEADVKWVRPESVHLTLKFLGDVPEDTIPALARAVADAVGGSGEISLGAKGLGFFPHARKPRVIWLGLAGDLDALAGLRKLTEKAVEPFGFEPENRPFRPHLTLGRIRSDRGLNALTVEAEGITPRLKHFTARELILFKSDLQPNGAVYTALNKIPLTAGE